MRATRGRIPITACARIDLPDPDSPTSATVPPAGTRNDTPLTARTVPASTSRYTLRSRTVRTSAMGRNAKRTKVGTRALVENFPAPRRLPGGERDKAGEFAQGRINPDRALRAAHLELHPSPRTIASRRVMVEPQRAHLIPGNTCTQRPAPRSRGRRAGRARADPPPVQTRRHPARTRSRWRVIRNDTRASRRCPIREQLTRRDPPNARQAARDLEQPREKLPGRLVMAGMVRKPAGCFARVRRAQAALRQMSDCKSERRLLACESTPGVPGD